MNIHDGLRNRRLGLSQRISIDFAVDKIRLKKVLKLPNLLHAAEMEDTVKTYGPLACAKLNKDVHAIANEDGCVNLLNINEFKNVSYWTAHDNAIFDIKASPDQKRVITASGDSTVKIWDVESKEEIISIKAHHSSIKSISLYDDNIFASGSRDGTIKIHDLRLKVPTQVVIRDAHKNLVLAKSRRSSAKTSPISCVTGVAFDPFYPRIYSTGANDATIKLWDLRFKGRSKLKTTSDGKTILNQPLLEVQHPSKGLYCGYSHLLLSQGRVYAACSDNKIYCYENFISETEPIRFAGFNHDTYLKLAIMDDRFLFSGGKGQGAMVWNLSNKSSCKYFPETIKQPVGRLMPDHTDRFDTNVVETDWDTLSVFTYRDDGLVCKWTMGNVHQKDRNQLVNGEILNNVESNITIQMSDIINVNVLRPNYQLSSSQQTTQRSQDPNIVRHE